MEEHYAHANIGELIKQLRKELGMTQKEFREAIGVGLRRMSEIENGKNAFKQTEIDYMLKVFKLSPDYFKNTINTKELPEPAKRLRRIRYMLGITQAEMAEKLTITQPNLASMENGNRVIGKHISNLILNAFDISPIWWETGEGKMFS